MEYNANYFRQALPDWKKKKEFILSRLFFREPSFYLTAFCANHHIKANTVSYLSVLVAVVGACCYLVPSYHFRIAGALLVWFWSVLDCVDGNLARSMEKQPFGAFADAMSSYVLVGLVCTTIGVSVYYEGGLLLTPGCHWAIVVGACASSSDSLMRLIYQKYKATERDLAMLGVLEPCYDKRTDETQTGSLLVRIESWLGIDGVLNIGLFMGTLFHALDIVLIYCFLYYGSACALSVMKLTKRAIDNAEKYSF